MDPLIGEIKIFAGNFAPRGWAFCDGQLLAISENQALFAILGTIYGGKGQTSFALPDLRGRVGIHSCSSTGPGLSSHLLGQRSGVENVTLNSTQIPSHAHAINASGGSSTSNTADLKVSDSVADTSDPASAKSVAGKVSAFSKVLSTTDATTVLKDCVIGIPSGSSIPSTTENTGGSQAHTNMQPYLVVNYIIALKGIYPSRN